jgi:hypothetical protein
VADSRIVYGDGDAEELGACRYLDEEGVHGLLHWVRCNIGARMKQPVHT